MENKKITVTEAQKICEKNGLPVTPVTIRSWCGKYQLGCKIGGRWYIDRKKLLEHIDGEI